MKRLLSGLLFLGLSCAVFAAGPNVVRKRAEASMLVTGSVVVAPDGKVSDYTIDQPDKLPPTVLALARKAVSGWSFTPVVVDGKARYAKGSMSLRFVTHRIDDAHYSVALSSAHFGGDYEPGTVVSYKDRSVMPGYPSDAVFARVTGTVYLVARIDRQGRVDAVDAEKVNLEEADSDAGMERWRKQLTQASIKAVRRWTFNPPTIGPHAQEDHWIARFPINFELSESGLPPQPKDSYGKWDVYIPGPVQSIPWLDDQHAAPDGVDAIPAGQLASADSELHLLTPLGGA